MPKRHKPRSSYGPFLRGVSLVRERVARFDEYPFSIPAIAALDELELHPQVTFFVGENGSGKSTLLEAIAVAVGFNAEGGTKNFNFGTRPSHSELHRCIRPVRGVRRPRDGFFLRAESYFNVGTEIERLDSEPAGGPRVIDGFGGVPIHEQSHGESFLRLAESRFGGEGLYLLDEPEAALSPTRLLSLLRIIHRLVAVEGSQMIIATHSPILLAYPHAKIIVMDAEGMHESTYEETDHFRLTRSFLNNHRRYLAEVLSAGPRPEHSADEE